MDDNTKLFISIVAGPLIALIVAIVVGVIIISTGIDPLITTGTALETPDIRPLSEIVTQCLLVPIPLFAFIGMVLFMVSETTAA